MYNVHVKNVTASDARKNWFRLLDEVAAGEIVRIRRGRKHLVLQVEPERAEEMAPPDYRLLISAGAGDEADSWGWDWTAEGLVCRDNTA
jgi:hypothetical protein